MLLKQMYQDGALATKEDCLVLARVALAERDYPVAAAVYQALLDDAASGKPRFKGRLSKARLKEIDHGLRYARLMLEQASPGEGPAAEPPGRRQTDLAPAS
uniref:Uncharacterized protein n=1 Tax=Desulfobacca acetoxidans TaxID=60893 RepID=A0A7C3Z1D2_9BACT